MTLAQQLLDAIKGTYPGLDVRIVEVSHTFSKCDVSINGNFYYLSFRNDAPTVDEFAKYVYHRIIPYCLPRKVRVEKDQRYVATKDPRYVHELTDQARTLFSKARKTQGKSGEPGEVVLFILLEAILKAPQIACKMYLKTSEEMPVHGTDSVHLGIGSAEAQLRLYWGESKLVANASSAIDAAIESIGSFVSAKLGRSPKERDLDIIRDHMDVVDPVLKQALLKYFDPYEKESLNLQEVFACFIGFEFWPKGIGSESEEKSIEDAFRIAYAERVASACESFIAKLKSAGLQHLKFHIFMIPFPCVKDFRKEFFQHLGVVDAD